jgi:hypothetical protein
MIHVTAWLAMLLQSSGVTSLAHMRERVKFAFNKAGVVNHASQANGLDTVSLNLLGEPSRTSLGSFPGL